MARRLYASDVELAGRSFLADDAAGMRQFLERQVPREGGVDRRGFAWRFLWAACHGERAVLADHSAAVYHVAYSPKGDRFATGGKDGAVRVRDAESGRTILTLEAGGGEVNGVEFSPDGKLLAAACADGAVRVFDAASVELDCRWYPSRQGVWDAEFSPDGRTLACAGAKGVVTLVDPATHKTVARLVGHEGPATRVAFSPDGRRLASGGWEDKAVIVWDVAERRMEARIGERDGGVLGLAFSPDGKLLAGVVDDRRLQVWNVGAWTQTWQHSLELGGSAVAFSPDGRVLYASEGNRLLRFHVGTWREAAKLPPASAQIRSIRFSPDGRAYATASADRRVRIWNASDHSLVHSLPSVNALVADACFSPDGREIALALDRGPVVVVEIAASQRLLELADGPFHSVEFSPDGKYLAGAGRTTGLMLWSTHRPEIDLPFAAIHCDLSVNEAEDVK